MASPGVPRSLADQLPQHPPISPHDHPLAEFLRALEDDSLES